MEDMELTEALKTKLEKAETLDDVVKACAEEGIEVTREQLEAAEVAKESELNEDDLDAVSGGIIAPAIALAIAIYAIWRYSRSRR